MRWIHLVAGVALAGIFLPKGGAFAQTDERNLIELRSTVVNILEQLVARGVLTEDEARTIVDDAQAFADVEIAEQEAQQADEEDAVRVTYVPDIVVDAIRDTVGDDLEEEVVTAVLQRAEDEGWGIPGALPAWVGRLDFDANVRVRSQGDFFDERNTRNAYLRFQNINEAGGVGLAGPDALLNTTEDRSRLRARLQVGVTAEVTSRLKANFQITTGNINEPISMNETLANYGRRLNFGVQNASIEWNLDSRRSTRSLDIYAGRFNNPFHATDLIFDRDLSFEGVATRAAFDLFRRGDDDVDHGIYLTLGAFPLEEVELTSDDKWLYASQLGMNIPMGRNSTFRISSAWYEYRNLVGLQNAPDSRLNDYSAPALLRRGNTLFDIRNDLDPETNLFALASDFELANALIEFDFGVFGRSRLVFAADYVENRGFDPVAVQARVGQLVEPRVKGHLLGLSIGQDRMERAGDWRVFAQYRYMERDAVLDAFTESDFALGGTDNEGYVVGFDIGVTDNAWASLRWLSSNEIDGPPLAIDVLQIDFNARFWR